MSIGNSDTMKCSYFAKNNLGLIYSGLNQFLQKQTNLIFEKRRALLTDFHLDASTYPKASYSKKTRFTAVLSKLKALLGQDQRRT